MAPSSPQSDAAKELTAVEHVKADSRHLRGELVAEFGDGTDHFSGDSGHLLKFHGIYQQDDRDVRRERTAARQSLLHSFMVRAAIPGGTLSAAQWLAMDQLAVDAAAEAPRGSGEVQASLRITVRQAIQYHFVAKSELRPLIGGLNRSLVTTLAACGDVARNVMGCPAPLAARNGVDLVRSAATLAAHVRPRTAAYYELWVDGEKAASVLEPSNGTPATGDDSIEPLYGATYLPRKFKIVFAWPGDNCVDLFSHDLGFVPTFAGDVVDSAKLEGFVVFAGGGMGKSHAREDDTYARLASPVGWVPAAAVGLAAEAVIGIYRDHGDRTDRARARLKYVIDDRGLDWFVANMRERLSERGVVLDTPRPIPAWTDDDEHLGWHEQIDGRFFRGIHVDAGRVVDTADGSMRLRSALAKLAASGLIDQVRLTPRQDVLLTGVSADRRAELDEVLTAHGVVDAANLRPVRRLAVACPALPTCPQALGEAERVLPNIVADAEAALAGAGLSELDVRVHVTGCPNGCARPYTAEIGIVGRTKSGYDVYVGGSASGERLNLRLGTDVKITSLPSLFDALFARYATERTEGESFGDYCARTGVGALSDAVPVPTPRRRAAST